MGHLKPTGLIDVEYSLDATLNSQAMADNWGGRPRSMFQEANVAFRATLDDGRGGPRVIVGCFWPGFTLQYGTKPSRWPGLVHAELRNAIAVAQHAGKGMCEVTSWL